MKIAHENEIAELKASLGATSSAELERLKAKHALEIKELKTQHEKLMASLNANFDRQLAQKEQDHVKNVEQL